MNTDQSAVHRLPREKLLRAIRSARKEYGLTDDYEPDNNSCSEDIILMINEICAERGLEFDAETLEFREAVMDESPHVWTDEGGGVTLGESMSR